ncbi:molybdopterin-dependent oxidoreductase [Eggerthellaceae bacterium zg-1084]|uniref:molybdopterin-dependent oxidoreductase n=1 Tax=Berryella wangjianweii TaxID=2734634 RepID=UPI0015578907|nr:molybdopterin-dependent oxidoreductase [Berryella wangjianweii]NPD30920.1 molybdopterin-dependent oxidoreductase [Berryella wangjianweii]
MGSRCDALDEGVVLDRRMFVRAGTATAAALAAGGSLTACAPRTGTAAGSKGASTTVANGEEGVWVTAACWHNCGGRCLNKVLVKDGKPVRQKTDDTHDDSPDFPQQRGCLRGRSQMRQVLSEDRLRYPMKRKGWSPDNPQGHLRGRDEWERISWDEALDYVAQGIARAKERYGNRSILHIGGWNSGITEMSRTLGLYGGYTEYWNTNSFGSWTKTPFLTGFAQLGKWDQTINDRYDLRTCDTIVMMSMNPAWSAMGSQTWGYWQAKKAGARFICIDPFYNETYSLLGAEWVPVRPGTDTALLLGVAYAMLEKDPVDQLIDWDFLKKCTVGFDAGMMPEGVDPQENFKDYVLGTYDGQPKDQQWASKICGAPVEQIDMLAQALTKQKKVAFLCGMASARVHNVDNLPQLIMTVGAMGGHMGKSGHMTGSTMHCTSGNGGPALIVAGSNGLPDIENPVDDSINANEVWDAVLDGEYTFTGPGSMSSAEQFGTGVRRDIDIHVIYHSGGATLQTSDGMKRGIEAHRKVDLVVSHAQFLTTNARYSDIVLPVITEWEKFGGFSGGTLVHSSNREMMIAYSQVIEPMYEAKGEQWIATEVAGRLGIDEKAVYPFDEKQQYFNALASMRVCDADGKTYVPAVTITQEDIDELGVEGSPQEGRMTYRELREKGVYQVERSADDNYGYIAFKDFVDDPDAHPLDTPSGKLEIHCQALADMVNGMGFSKIRPIPTYIPVAQGYEKAAAEGSRYPLQVINPHYLRRAHSVFDNVDWLREAWANPVFLNRDDAESVGVADGDAVLVSSPYGAVVRNATLTAALMPGVVALPHGAWVDVDEETGIDRAGADNYLTGQVPNGQGVSGFNSMICRIDKYEGDSLAADVSQPPRMAYGEGE